MVLFKELIDDSQVFARDRCGGSGGVACSALSVMWSIHPPAEDELRPKSYQLSCQLPTATSYDFSNNLNVIYNSRTPTP